MNDMKITPTQFFATLLFHRPGLTAREMVDAYLTYDGKDPCEKRKTKVFSWSTEKWRDARVRKWAGWYSSYFYTKHSESWKSKYGMVGGNGRQLGRLWKSTEQSGTKKFFLLPLGYRKIAITTDGKPLNLTYYLSKQLSFSFEPPKCA